MTLRMIVALALLVTACSGSGESVTTTTVPTEGTPATTESAAGGTDAVEVPPELADHDLDMVVVGDRLLLVAIADSPSLRKQGLMGVTDLGDLDGMLFYWRHEAHGGFWMKDTLIPLDIVWFLEDGTYAGRASMEPCREANSDDCPVYIPGEGLDYRFAIEANPGELDWIDEDTVIAYSD